MKQHSKFMTALVAALLVTASGAAQTAQGKSSTTARKSRRTTATHPVRRTRRTPVESAQARQLREMREQLAGQQAQIDALKGQIATRDSQVAAAQQSAAEAQQQVASAATATAAAAAQSTQNAQDVEQLKVSVGDLNTKSDTLTQTVVQNQAQVQEQINSPSALHYKGVTIQPVGFAAFEGVWRQRSVNSDINTPFNTIPLPSANEGHISELNFSGRQSRLGALVSAHPGTLSLAAYFEADFLSSGTTSNNNQSNSYTFRQRQFWGQVNKRGFTLTGGQMWSLVTEDLRSTDNRTEVLPNTVDPQYMVGFNWTRQPGLRFQQTFGDPRGKGGFTAALAIEQAQITNFTAQGPTVSTTSGTTTTTTTNNGVPTNFFFGGTGVNGGLYNAFNGTYANNVAPDVLVKFAWDTPHSHVEAGGLARFLRDTYYPVTSVTAASYLAPVVYKYSANPQNDTKFAGGGYASARVGLAKYLDVGLQGMAGTGTGRYGSAQLADATIHPNGTLEPIRNYHGLASLITHEGKNLDIFGYYGGEYDQRTIYATAGGTLIGYGPYDLNNGGCYALPANPGTSTGGTDSSPSSCQAPTRYIQEGMFGFIYRAYNNPRYGRLQYTATYSYLQRNLWSAGTAPGGVTGPRAEDNMIHVGMRYYIP